MNKKIVKYSLIWGIFMFLIHSILAPESFSIKYLFIFLFIAFVIVISINKFSKILSSFYNNIFK